MAGDQLTGWGVKLYLLGLAGLAVYLVGWAANRYLFPQQDRIVVLSAVAVAVVFGGFLLFFRDIVR